MTDQQQAGGLHYNKTPHWEESLKKVHLVHNILSRKPQRSDAIHKRPELFVLWLTATKRGRNREEYSWEVNKCFSLKTYSRIVVL